MATLAQLEHIEAIEKRLWRADDLLRTISNYASNEYFLPVMWLVFLRYAYNRYLAVKEKIEPAGTARPGRWPRKISPSKAASFFRRRSYSIISWLYTAGNLPKPEIYSCLV